MARKRREHPFPLLDRWWVYLGAVALVCAGSYGLSLAVRHTDSYTVPAASMTPNVIVGDYITADNYAPRLAAIKRGDVILFLRQGTVFIKRVIGLPGDQVAMDNDVLSVNGKALMQVMETDLTAAGITAADVKNDILYRETWPDGRSIFILRKDGGNEYNSFSNMIVPDGTVFVLGDSRDNSNDSRMFGPVSQDQIVGRASFIWWSKNLGRIGRLIN